jgi:hypothetical protein
MTAPASCSVIAYQSRRRERMHIMSRPPAGLVIDRTMTATPPSDEPPAAIPVLSAATLIR